MSNWQFASREGMLTWSNPALPESGQTMFSVLSPTLLMGYQQQGDPLPLDFIKLSAVSSVSQSGSAIDISRRDGMNMRLVATSPNDAGEWLRMINLALQGSGANVPQQQAAPAPAQQQTRSLQQQQQQQQDPRPAPQFVAQPDASRPAAASATSKWLQSSYQQFSGQLGLDAADAAANPTPIDRQSPRRNRDSDPEGPVRDPYFTGADTAASLESTQRPPQPPASRPQWASPDVRVQQQQPEPQPYCDVDPTGHEFRPVSAFTQGAGAKAYTTTTTQHDEVRFFNGSTNPAELRPLPGEYSSIPGQRYSASQPQPAGASGLLNSSGSFGYANNYVAAGGTKRSMMMVDVPASQTYNRNLAPNPSAVWKEWKDPQNNVILFHEPTGTLQRIVPGTNEIETLVEGTAPISEHDLASRPMYTGNETTIDIEARTVRNIENYGYDAYGGGGAGRSMLPPEGPVNRGQYSPTRRAPLEILAQPQHGPSGYHGRRVHKLVLDGTTNQSTVEHQVQSLDAAGVLWDPKSGVAINAAGTARGDIGMSTLQRQWEHVRKVLMDGRYFKKHALRTQQASFRYVFLTADNAYVVCVPTSEVLLNVTDRGAQSFGTVAETAQYYGPDSRAIALNTITHVSLGIEEEFVRRRQGLVPENVFCIVSKTHAFILECNTEEEARYFCDAWTFFLYHSRPLNPKKTRTPQMVAPVTHGLRGGVKF